MDVRSKIWMFMYVRWVIFHPLLYFTIQKKSNLLVEGKIYFWSHQELRSRRWQVVEVAFVVLPCRNPWANVIKLLFFVT